MSLICCRKVAIVLWNFSHAGFAICHLYCVGHSSSLIFCTRWDLDTGSVQPQFWGMILPSRQCGTSGWQALNVLILLLPSLGLLNKPLSLHVNNYVLFPLPWYSFRELRFTGYLQLMASRVASSLMCWVQLYLLCHALVTEVLVW